MEFLSQTFKFSIYYHMVKKVFDIIGYDYYKGLKNKLPPVRYMGKDEAENDLVIFAHPKDFSKSVDIFKTAFNDVSESINEKCNIVDKLNEILEVYPSTDDLYQMPNGFIGLFVNDLGMEKVIAEFNQNDEVHSLKFLPVLDEGIDYTDVKLNGAIETFIKKFNNRPNMINKYYGLYLVVGEMKDMDIKTGLTRATNKYNIIGGKRNLNEDSVESTIREIREELGLLPESNLYKFINTFLPKTKDVIKCHSFTVFCIYYTPTIHNKYKNNVL